MAIAGQKNRALVGWILVIPALLVFLLMIAYPFLNSIWLSFTDKNLIFPNEQFVGLSNYIKLFTDPYLWKLIRTTLTFVVLATLCPFILGFGWALVMNQKFKGSEFMRGLTLVNWIIPGIAIAFLWSWVFNGDYGILNAILIRLGILEENIVWLGRTSTAMGTVITARTWQMFPWYMSFILGGLQGVSKEQLEAARIDGASNIQCFFHVIIPTILPTVSLILILGTIGNFQHFDLINVMTAGGPEGSTATFATEVYRQAFKTYEVGCAASLGVVWAILLAGFSIIYLRRIRED